MGRKTFFHIWILCLILLTGCGNKQENRTPEEPQEYYDILTETQQLFDIVETPELHFLGMQYYQGERIQLWAEKKSKTENGTLLMEGDVYLCREDGSRELLLENLPYDIVSTGTWWLHEEGWYLILASNGVRKLDQEGNELYFKQTGENVKDLCQLTDGSILLLINDSGERRLAELDLDTGMLTIQKNITLGYGNQYISAGENGVLLLDADGLWEINLTNGGKKSLMAFAGTSYAWKTGAVGIEDFRMLEDGSLEVLWENGQVETLLWSRVSDDKIPITMRNTYITDWMKEQVVRFNKLDTGYYIVLEEAGVGTNRQDFRARTDLEIAAGKGADIICGGAVNDAYNLMTKGAFENLAPLMGDTNIREDDYFPLAFSGWRSGEKIYGLNPVVQIEGLWIDSTLAGSLSGTGSNQGLGIEMLVDNMLADQGQKIFMEGYEAADILRCFLQGSESLLGMIDWQHGTCNFEGELFQKLLEVSKRYSDQGTTGYQGIAGIRDFSSFYWFDRAEELKRAGKFSIGYCFDDGFHEWARPEMMAINVHSAHKEGAWKFLAFLLEEEVQSTIDMKNNYTMGFPVNKQIYDQLKEEAILSGTVQEGQWTVNYGSFSKADAEELTKVIEGARPFPLRTEPVLNLICDQANAYFTDGKKIEEVCAVIQKQVQLYLDENRE